MSGELVTIASYPNAAEAEIARAALESEGIKGYTTDDAVVGAVWLLGNAVGYVKLLVAADDTQRAQAVLRAAGRQAQGDSLAEAGEAEEGPTDLTNLGDDEARRAWRAAIFGLVFFPPLLSLYSIYLLLKLGGSDLPLSPRGRDNVVGATLVNLLMLIVVIALTTSLSILK